MFKRTVKYRLDPTTVRGPKKRPPVCFALRSLGSVLRLLCNEKNMFAPSLLPVPLRSALLKLSVRLRCLLYAIKSEASPDVSNKEM